MVHLFPHRILECELPTKFTFPFCYEPHPLCVEAARLVQKEILSMNSEWKSEVEAGKMFGVLLVRLPDRQVGFLAAFSGNICGTNVHPYFVPPIYDLLDPQGFFKPKEAYISKINHRIDALLSSNEYQKLLINRDFCERHATQEIIDFREEIKRKKICRNERRNQLLSIQEKKGSAFVEDALQQLTHESQFMKAELKRKEKSRNAVLASLDAQIAVYKNEVECLKEERKKLSAKLQNEIFEKYVLLNASGKKMNILQIFKKYSDREAPAGTGECAAPKLLQFAYLNHLKPLAMAEFWWGKSPVSEVRHQGHFYPSCHSKCEPLLNFMLEGLEVEENPLIGRNQTPVLTSIYEDEWYMAVIKPAGLLSVPGKEGEMSVYSIVHHQHPEFTGPLVIHRLDLSTSGLLLIAKSEEAYVQMQKMFESRSIRKRYVAILDGLLSQRKPSLPNKGEIHLPLCPDVNDRPRQMVSFDYGKEASTEYQVLSEHDGHTRIAFWPITGRTHQLRVHAAHSQGLDTPILGDTLYGSTGSRLFLHASSIFFKHPYTGESIEIHSEPEF